MANNQQNLNWKSFYATDIFDWHQTTLNGRQFQYRRLGIVENLFDTDGVDYEGRADLNIHIDVELKTRLSDNELRHRVLLAWAYLRVLFPLLACKSLYAADFLPASHGRRWIDKCFVYETPTNPQQYIDTADNHLIFVQDHHPELDSEDFFKHLVNTGRAIDEKEALSKLFITSIQKAGSSHRELSMMLVAGHEVSDGITAYRIPDTLVHLLNMDQQELQQHISSICSEREWSTTNMPPAQESLYPVRSPNLARERWNWAITRILRHVRIPPPASFQNPLRRETPLTTAWKMQESYPKVLDYTKTPPLNASRLKVSLSQRATTNLKTLCRQAGISVGSGAFTLTGMMMMRFEESRNPNIPLQARLPFVGSFPVNPRPFLSGTPTTGKENSVMLAFSDGITLPFIPSHLDFIKTFRVLGRLAHRQLRQYQKRRRTAAEEIHLGSRNPKELLPALYLSTMERLEGKVKPAERVGLLPPNAYPPRSSLTLATCGISSVGDATGLITSDRYDLSDESNKDLVAVFRDVCSTVRPREGEFLVGAIGMRHHMQFRVSYDASSIDPEKAQAWKDAMESILEVDLEEEERKRSGENTSGRSKL